MAMGKVKFKPNKGVKKRVRVTARGKIVYHRSNSAHLLSGKSGKRLRRLRKPGVLAQVFADRLVIALGKHGA